MALGMQASYCTIKVLMKYGRIHAVTSLFDDTFQQILNTGELNNFFIILFVLFSKEFIIKNTAWFDKEASITKKQRC